MLTSNALRDIIISQERFLYLTSTATQDNTIGGERVEELDYSKMTTEEINFIICLSVARIEQANKKINSLLISSICHSIALIILAVKLFL